MRKRFAAVLAYPFSSPEPVLSWSRRRLQIKPTGSGDENGPHLNLAPELYFCTADGVTERFPSLYKRIAASANQIGLIYFEKGTHEMSLPYLLELAPQLGQKEVNNQNQKKLSLVV